MKNSAKSKPPSGGLPETAKPALMRQAKGDVMKKRKPLHIIPVTIEEARKLPNMLGSLVPPYLEEGESYIAWGERIKYVLKD